MQGRPGDHPLTDILIHNMKIGDEETRSMLKEIYEANGRRLHIFKDLDWSKDLKPQLVELKEKF